MVHPAQTEGMQNLPLELQAQISRVGSGLQWKEPAIRTLQGYSRTKGVILKRDRTDVPLV